MLEPTRPNRWIAVAVPLLLAASAGTAEPVEEQPSPAVALAARLLGDWIRQSRDRAVDLGTYPIPADIREALSGYVPKDTLDRARWREVDGDSLGWMMESAFEAHPTPAMTLDFVIVFRDAEDAADDAALWAHELKHVMQYERWGVDGFALRYVSDFEAVEFEASEYRWGWLERQRLAKEAAEARK